MRVSRIAVLMMALAVQPVQSWAEGKANYAAAVGGPTGKDGEKQSESKESADQQSTQ